MKKVEVYTVTWCPHCVRLLEYLDSRGIPFANHDVDSSDEKWKEALSFTGGVDIVPVVNVEGRAIFGAFTPDFQMRLEKLLEIREK